MFRILFQTKNITDMPVDMSALNKFLKGGDEVSFFYIFSRDW